MALLQQTARGMKAFIIDYCQRHAHPINAFLHIFGVPMAFYGFFKLLTGKLLIGSALVFVGYLCQYLGHKSQGNEVGEVTLIKKLWRRLSAANSAPTGNGR